MAYHSIIMITAVLKRIVCLAVIGILAIAAGCSTPDSRIRKNPELFATFSPETQELIRSGQVDIGFTSDMVTMSLGTPNRIYTRQTGERILEVWSYTSSFTTTDRQRVRVDVRTNDPRGKSVSSKEWVYVNVPRDTEYERIRVELTEGVVTAIDTLQR